VLQGAEGLDADALQQHLTSLGDDVQQALDARDETTRSFTLADVNENATPIVLTMQGE
jgi:hypothetical protein